MSRATGRIARTLLGTPWSAALFLRLLRFAGRPVTTVLMLHRFTDPALGAEGEDPGALRRILALLRRQGVEFLSLRDLMARIEEGRPASRPTIVVTVDDGYRDFATAGADALAEFDCPATLFLTTDVVNGQLWHWWDELEFAFLASPRHEVQVEFAGGQMNFPLGDRAKRLRSCALLAELLKTVPDDELRRVVAGIGKATDVDVPATPIPKYAVVDWSDVRRLEGKGVEFGPHTLTHPILSQVDDERARREIAGSWEALQRHCANPVPVFCYPNGTRASFLPRDERLVAQSGMRGAVVYFRDRVRSERVTAAERFLIPRVEFIGEPLAAAYTVSGFGRLR